MTTSINFMTTKQPTQPNSTTKKATTGAPNIPFDYYPPTPSPTAWKPTTSTSQPAPKPATPMQPFGQRADQYRTIQPNPSPSINPLPISNPVRAATPAPSNPSSIPWHSQPQPQPPPDTWQLAPWGGGIPKPNSPYGGGASVPADVRIGYGGGYNSPYEQMLGINKLKEDEFRAAQMRMQAMNLGQNAYQYLNDFNEGRARYWDESAWGKHRDTFSMGLAQRQQMSAEEQARLAAEQWRQQFGHTTQMDIQGMELQRQRIGNEFTMGMDANAARRYEADQQRLAQLGSAQMYSGAQRYGAELGLQGQRYSAELGLQGQLGTAQMYSGAQRYGAELGLQGQLGTAQMYSGAQRYGAELGLQGQLGSAQMYSGAQRYGAELGLQGQLGSAQMYSGAQRYGAELGLQGQLGSAQMYSGAQRYGAELGLQGQLGSAQMYSGAQRYGAELGLQGQLASAQMYSGAQRYGAELGLQGQLGSAQLYSEAQRYGTDVGAETQRYQAQLAAEAQRYAANMSAFGRRAAPTTTWQRNW